MMRNNPFYTNKRLPLPVVAGVLILLLCLAPPLRAEFYKYTDKAGNVYFVDDISQVPPEYRSQIETYREKYDHLSEQDKKLLLDKERQQSLDNQEQIELHLEKYQVESTEEDNRRRERELMQSRRRMETKVKIQDNRILVPVTFSNIGIDLSANLLLDTGASHTVLHRQVAEQLRIITIAKGYAKTAGGQNILSELGSVDALKVGPIVMKDAQVIVFTHQGPPAGYDGLLGMNFLSRVQYNIDYERQVISWQVR